MISHYLSSLQGMETWGAVSTVVALLGFLAVVFWAVRLKRSHVDRMANLPLEGDPDLPDNLKKV